jgi:hypothetical protein
VAPDEVAAELAAISSSSMDWIKQEDVELKRCLTRLALRLDRMRRLKKGGASAYPDDLAGRIRDLLVRLQHVGLFLVPVGELEEWLASENLGVSKEKNKWAWANAAAERILKLGPQKRDIWDFVSAVGGYLKSALGVNVPKNSQPDEAAGR